MWQLYQSAKVMGTNPAEATGVDAYGSWVAYDFNAAVLHVGNHIESELNKIRLTSSEKKMANPSGELAEKRTRRLRELLGLKKKKPFTIDLMRQLGIPIEE